MEPNIVKEILGEIFEKEDAFCKKNMGGMSREALLDVFIFYLGNVHSKIWSDTMTLKS